MANIQDKLNNIKNALFGKDVRNSIHDGIDAINKEVESTTGRQVDLEKTFDQLVINAGNSNAEIVDARVKSDGTSYPKLGDRLNEVDSQLEHNANIINVIKNQFINVKLFGAKGDGVTDDTESIQTALKNLNDEGGTIFFPSGTYLLNSALEVVDKNVSFLGCGEGSNIIVNDTFINFSKTDSIKLYQYKIEKLKFYKHNTGNIINITYTSQSSNQNYGLKIIDCWFESNNIATAINVVNSADLDIDNCNFMQNECCISMVGIINSRITNSTFSNNKNSINIIGELGNKEGTCGVVISNCTIIGNEEAPILKNGDYLKISDCIIDYNQTPLILEENISAHINNCYIGSETDYVITVTGGFYHEVSNNRIVSYSAIGNGLYMGCQGLVDSCYFSNALKQIVLGSHQVNISNCYFSRTQKNTAIDFTDNKYVSLLSNNIFEETGEILSGSLQNVRLNNNYGYKLSDEIKSIIIPQGYSSIQSIYDKVKTPKVLTCLDAGICYLNSSGRITVKTLDGQPVSEDTAIRVSIVL